MLIRDKIRAIQVVAMLLPLFNSQLTTDNKQLIFVINIINSCESLVVGPPKADRVVS